MILLRSLWLSPQVSALDPLERTLMMEMTALYTGPKPVADIFLGVRDAARRCGVIDTKAITRAFNNLIALGLITEVVAGSFASKGGGKSKARGWRLNWKAADGGQLSADALPQLDFGKLDRRQARRVAERSTALKAYAKSGFSVVDSTTLTAIRADMLADSVEDSPTLTPKNGTLASSPTVGDSATHISYQGVRGAVANLRRSITATGLGNENEAAPFRAAATPERFCGLVNLRLAARREMGA